MDGLFPDLPKDLTKLSDDELVALLAEHEQAADLIEKDDPEFLEGLDAEGILEQFKGGALQIMAIREELSNREKALEDYKSSIAEVADSIKPEVVAESTEGGDGDEGDGDGDGEGEGAGDGEDADAEVKAESGDGDAGDGGDEGGEGDGEGAEKKELALIASGEEKAEGEEKPAPRLRRLPTPSRERIVVNEGADEALAFIASGYVANQPPGSKLRTRRELADAIHAVAKSLGRPAKRADGREERYLVASLNYLENFPEARRLDGNLEKNNDKIAAIGSPYLGQPGLMALVASGGFCAPLQPLYTMPQLATNARPVRDALPSFRAERGGINVPAPTTVSDAAGAITVITADDDELGGTFATKACLDLDCPNYTETAVTIISHCREFGNLNAMAWPEKIAHENEITMAEHARVAESYLLSRIKAQSIAVTSGATTLGALIYLVDAIEKAEFGMRGRLRLPSDQRFTLLAPRVLLDVLELDTISTQFDRYRTQAEIEGYLAQIGVDVTWYIDTASPRPGVSDGTSQLPDSAQTAAALDGFPATYDVAFFPSGTFLHLDMAELNLGIVRDSTLNSTNDFQIFGESFENVARIGPAQAAYWMTLDICPTGVFPALGTARTCE
jgi:hypothetical protein